MEKEFKWAAPNHVPTSSTFVSWTISQLLFSVLSGIIIITFLFSYLDQYFGKEFRNFTSDLNLCEPSLEGDLLAKSASDRIRTRACRARLNHQLCAVVYQTYWPTEVIKNTCEDLFDIDKLYSYVGCFLDSTSDRLLKEYKFNVSSQNNPGFCVQNCLRAGFSLAGLHFDSQECFCGSSNDVQKLFQQNQTIDNSFCQHYPCSATDMPAHDCTGFNAMAVYWTGVKRKHVMTKMKSLKLQNRVDQSKVKILFLLQLNGRNSRQIRRLLRMIYSSDHLYYIHVDVRQKFMQNEMLRIQEELKARGFTNFRVAQRRMSTIWGGSSLLELFLWVIAETLGDSARGQWSDWDYILNLSETDMPLQSLEELERVLARNIGYSFLSSHGYNTGTFFHKQGFHFHFMECEQRMWRVSTRNNYPRNLRLDGGSDWVVIHREPAQFAISNLILPSQLRLLFSTILLPLESFFHTLVANNGEFCHRTIYRNLRFTNWNRKQGCRCASLKPVVDWCGCSPLALKAGEAGRKVTLEVSQAKSQFFGRKFDSFIDIEPIGMVEKTALRFRPDLIPSDQSASYNSFWLNIYSSEIPSDFTSVLNIDLLTHFARSLVALVLPKMCIFRSLHDLYVYKSLSIAPIQNIFSFSTSCNHFPTQNSLIQLLIGQKNYSDDKFHSHQDGIVIHEGIGFSFDNNMGIEFGIAFDLKEEIFRIFPAVLSMSTKFTLKWRWRMDNTNDHGRRVNITSPPVELVLLGPMQNMSFSLHVPPYNSLYGTQFVDIDPGQLQNSIPGLWTAILYTNDPSQRPVKISERSIPIFPTAGDTAWDIGVDHGLFDLYTIGGICAEEIGRNCCEPELPTCSTVPWSSLFVDEKSIFP